MRKFLTTAVAVALISATSYADLQNVVVGGGIRIRMNGSFRGDNAPADQSTEQRSNLSWTADFTDEVSAVIELDNHGAWGTDTRDTIGGNAGGSGSSAANVYQAYIELGEAWGTALDIKVGRQEIMLGSEFLIGNNDTASAFTGLSFDGVTAVYNADNFSVTGIVVKVVEADAGTVVNDRDTDLYALYLSYTGVEDMTIDGYWMFVDTGIAGDDGDNLHTIGARVAGTAGQFDYEVEAALQTGEQSATVDYDGIAVNSEVGYTFDTNLQPRLFGGVTLFEGPSTDLTDTGFNRMFSDWEYSEFLSNTDISNVLIIRLGASIQATEKINLSIVASDFTLDEENKDLSGSILAINYVPGNTEDHVGTEIGLYANYAYSDDVSIEAGYAHFLIEEDLFGDGVDDLDYVYAEISIAF